MALRNRRGRVSAEYHCQRDSGQAPSSSEQIRWEEAVKAVQLERGSSCIWVASHGQDQAFGDLVENHRSRVDECSSNGSSLGLIYEELDKKRWPD